MDWKAEADRVADGVFERIDDSSRLVELNKFWSFNEKHSSLFDAIPGTKKEFGEEICLTQMRYLGQYEGRQTRNLLFQQIVDDERIPLDCDPLLDDAPSKEEFRRRLDVFVEWREKLEVTHGLES